LRQVVRVKNLWAYAYEIVPPQRSGRMGRIRALLKSATLAARENVRTWSGRLVFAPRATHILIVSDDPTRDQTVNLRIETELLRLGAPFSVTRPLVVADPAEETDTVVNYQGNGRVIPTN